MKSDKGERRVVIMLDSLTSLPGPSNFLCSFTPSLSVSIARGQAIRGHLGGRVAYKAGVVANEKALYILGRRGSPLGGRGSKEIELCVLGSSGSQTRWEGLQAEKK